MKFLATLFFFFVLAVAVFAAPTVNDGPEVPARKCVAGKRYSDGCNRCWCGPKGDTVCTLKLCYTHNPDGTIIEVKRVEPPADYWQS